MRRLGFKIFLTIAVTSLFYFIGLLINAAETREVIIQLNEVSALQGQGTSMSLYLDTETPYSAVEVSIYYDAEYFSVNYLSMSAIYDSYTHQKDTYVSQEGIISYILITDQDVSVNGNLLNINFSIDSQTPVDTYPIYVAVNGFMNDQFETIPVQIIHGSISVQEQQVSAKYIQYYSQLSQESVEMGQQITWTINSYNMYKLAASNYEIHYSKDELAVESVELGSGLLNSGVIMESNISNPGLINIALLKVDGIDYATPLFYITFEVIVDEDRTSQIKFTPKNSVDVDFISLIGNEMVKNFTISKKEVPTTYPKLSLSDYTGYITDTIYVDVEIDSLSHLAAGDFVITYDSTFVTYQNYETIYQGGYLIVNDQLGTNEISFSFIDSDGINSDVTLLRLAFKAKEEQEGQGTISITGTNLVDSSLDPIVLDFESSLITLKRAFNVIFKEYDGTVIDEQVVLNGSLPNEPIVTPRDGTTFIGWDKEISIISTDVTYQALYSLNTEDLVFVDKTVTYDGLAHSIETNDLPVGATTKYIEPPVINVGEYILTVEYYLDNVLQGFDQAILTIEPKPITITIHNQQMIEKMEISTFTYDIDGLIAGDDLGIEISTDTSTPGEHVITASITNDNYIATIIDGVLEVLPFPYLMGDISQDETVSIMDVAMLQLYLADLITLDEFQLVSGDVNNDKSITLHDIAKLQLNIANLTQLN